MNYELSACFYVFGDGLIARGTFIVEDYTASEVIFLQLLYLNNFQQADFGRGL